jgi:ankyrin repeat protein
MTIKTGIVYWCFIKLTTTLINVNGHTDIVQILLDNNCDITNGAINGACEGGYKDIVEILMKHNVDINQCGGRSNKTPIYYACSNGHTDIVQILLDNNCDIPNGAINGACEGGYKDIVEILMKHNVAPTTTLINVNIMFHQNLNNVFITSFTGSIYSTMNVTIIVKQNLYNICMTITTGIVYWCFINLTTMLINISIIFYQNLNNVFISSFTGSI